MGQAITIDIEAKQALEIITELLVTPGEINIGYDDIKAIIRQQGPVLISTGSGAGNDRILKACHDALTNPWKETTIKAATKVLVNITGPTDLLLKEVNDGVDMVKERMATSAEVIYGVTLNGKYDDEVKVILLAGGIQT